MGARDQVKHQTWIEKEFLTTLKISITNAAKTVSGIHKTSYEHLRIKNVPNLQSDIIMCYDAFKLSQYANKGIHKLLTNILR